MRHGALLPSLIISFILSSGILAQPEDPPDPTPASERLQGYTQRQQMRITSMTASVPFRNIGPTVFSGRVTDIDVNPADPTHFYVAYASGGLWSTSNNGNSFDPIFDREAVMTIGDVAVDWDHDIIWVGTGENNSSRSSYAGVGIFKSVDGGETWQHLGLPESHHIGRIVLHPDDPNTVWVAVLGHLYSPNEERGVYKTTDGGTSWERILYVSDHCGAVDLHLDPDNPQRLYAATWERSRRAWNFVEAGPGSAIYMSENGGETWTLMTSEGSGFPTGDGVGRIGMDVASTPAGIVVYAVLDNYFRREADPEKPDVLTRQEVRLMKSDAFLHLEHDMIREFLTSHNFPEEYTVDTVLQLMRNKAITPLTLVEYLEDANTLLFETDVIGAEVYVSRDLGVSWQKTHDGFIDRLYYSYGYYFGQIRISPFNHQKLYLLGVPILMSEDGGATWVSVNGDNVHVDHHALWVSGQREGHLILGNDGGINISYDSGEHWFKCNSPPVGQFYTVAVDRADPYHVYGGLQDNGVWHGPHTYEPGLRWHSTGDYPYKELLGGDGMQVEVDYRDNNTVYTGMQFGNYYRIDKKRDQRTRITPRHSLTERPYRWNWQSPIHLSRHHQDILYMGSHMVHRSLDRGDTFTRISDDLTSGGIQGDVPYGTLTSIDESPLQFGLLYAGSDDGRVHMTKDMGTSWKRVSDDLPPHLWVSRVEASNHETGRVYVTLNGYRWDHFTAYVYVSDDFGETWERIGLDLPPEPVNVMLEDPADPNVLFVGTDNGLYVSIDRGVTFQILGDLPAAPVHDLAYHPVARDLIVATHGRSLYRGHVGPVSKLPVLVPEKVLHVFSIPESPLRFRQRWGNRNADWSEYNTPEMRIPFYVRTKGPVRWEVVKDDLTLQGGTLTASRGLNYYSYDLTVDSTMVQAYRTILNTGEEVVEVEPSDNNSTYLRPGHYIWRMHTGGETEGTEFEIK